MPRGPLPADPARALADVGGAPIDPPRTRVSLAWDDDAFRVAFAAEAAPPLAAGVSERHGPVYEDECVELFLADAADGTRYTEVVVNPAGTVYCARVANPDGSRETWSLERGVEIPGLSVEVAGEPPGAPERFTRWRCRIALPWGGPPPAAGTVRRGNLYRIARGRTTRYEALSPTLRSDPPDFHVPARFATFLLE